VRAEQLVEPTDLSVLADLGPETPHRPSRRWHIARPRVVIPVLGLTAVAVLARIPTFGVPLDDDEGGYAYVAHQWAQGGHLYTNPWIDRPQGLLLVFRAVADASYSVAGIRTAAVLAGVVLTLAVAAAGWAVGGRRAGVLAGGLAAVVGAGSFIEGYELNGELLGSAFGTSGVALALWWSRGRLSDRWLLAAGILCGLAPLMKQSMVDGAVALACITVAARKPRALAIALGGVFLGPLVAVLWALRLGWHEWWFAVVRFQFTRSVGGVHDHLKNIEHTAHVAAFDVVGLGCAAVLALVLTRRSSGRWPLVAWLVAALVCVLGGAFSNPHYWVQVVAPLSVLASTASLAPFTRQRRLMVEALVVILALSLPIARLVQLSVVTPAQRDARVVPRADSHRLAQADLARWFKQNTSAADSVFAFPAAADLYLRIDRTTAFPYLWWTPLQHVPGALESLRVWLAGPQAPRFVVVYRSAVRVDRQGPMAGILDTHYEQVSMVDGYAIMQHRD
jgi:4-amino-4-deoxy-L-arabinose transferase-like glycosyltransferase